MKDVLSYLWLKGGVDSERPWGQEEKVRFVCPVPGYDRHFTLLEWFGIEMVPVPMTDDGPDVDAVAALVADDPSIKGMWLVPTYANPTGQVTTQEVAERLASMPTAAPDFKIFWDNAYALHHLTARRDQDRRHPVAGRRRRATRTARSCSPRPPRSPTPAPASPSSAAPSETVAWYHDNLGLGSIGPDKVNQLRHLRVLRDPAGRARPHGQAPRAARAEVRRGGADPHRAARRTRASRPGPTRAAATSSASTCCPAPRAA